MDGGTTWNVNISSAINGCLTKVDDLSKITVDILICSDQHNISAFTPSTTIDNFLRGHSIKKYYSGLDAIQTHLAAFPGVNWRYLIEEHDAYGGKDELNFNNDMTWPLQLRGRE